VYSKTPLRVISKSVHAEDGLAAGERQGLDEEGRVLAVEVGGIKLVNVYTPNSGQGLVRLASRTTAWDPAFRRTVVDLAAGAAGAAAPVVVMGDLNVALRDMDIHNPKANRNKSAGFCDAERDGMADLLAAGFTDVWAAKYPTTAQYTCVSPLFIRLRCSHACSPHHTTAATQTHAQVLGRAAVWLAGREQGLAAGLCAHLRRH